MRYNQKISATARRIEKLEFCNPVVKLIEQFRVGFYPIKFFPQSIQKERIDNLQDVLFTGVMHPKLTTQVLTHEFFRLTGFAEKNGKNLVIQFVKCGNAISHFFLRSLRTFFVSSLGMNVGGAVNF